MAKRSATVLDRPPARREKTAMAVAVITGPRLIEIRFVPVPEPARGPHVYVRGMEEAVRAAAAGAFPMPKLLTHRYSLDELALALRDREERPDGFLKGWIHYD